MLLVRTRCFLAAATWTQRKDSSTPSSTIRPRIIGATERTLSATAANMSAEIHKQHTNPHTHTHTRLSHTHSHSSCTCCAVCALFFQTLIERDYSADDDMPDAADTSAAASSVKIPDSKLDSRVQDLIKLICDLKMMKDAMLEVGYDADKLPLGKVRTTTTDNIHSRHPV